MRRAFALLLAVSLATPCWSAPARAGLDEASFRALFKELVETNTVFGEGSCTLAARQIAAHLRAAGYPDRDLDLFAPDGHPKEGGLVAVLPGTDPQAKAILLLGHLDVVPARREDWGRDPFTLLEQDGFFRARGVADMKGIIAVWADSMMRLRAETRPPRTVRMVLTCGEEGQGVNGLRWLLANKPDLVRGAFALNEGGGGRLSDAGKPVALSFQVLEKTYADFDLVTTNPGGHSSVPRPDNAILQLGSALQRIGAYRFPVRLNDTTRAFFARTAETAPPPFAAAMRAIVANPASLAAQEVLATDPQYNAMLRTTCVVTRIVGGVQNNALPQRASANVNCRILPGETVAGTLKRLREVTADAGVAIAPAEGGTQEALAQTLPVAEFRTAERLAAEAFPGVPMLPVMTVAASDSPALIATGVPVYGAPGILYEADGGAIHGLNERVRVKSLLDGRAYLYRLITAYANER